MRLDARQRQTNDIGAYSALLHSILRRLPGLVPASQAGQCLRRFVERDRGILVIPRYSRAPRVIAGMQQDPACRARAWHRRTGAGPAPSTAAASRTAASGAAGKSAHAATLQVGLAPVSRARSS